MFFMTFWLHFGDFGTPKCTLILHLWGQRPPGGHGWGHMAPKWCPKGSKWSSKGAKMEPQSPKWSPKVPTWSQKGTPEGPHDPKGVNMRTNSAPLGSKWSHGAQMVPKWYQHGAKMVPKWCCCCCCCSCWCCCSVIAFVSLLQCHSQRCFPFSS